jgi:hypothetical protein
MGLICGPKTFEKRAFEEFNLVRASHPTLLTLPTACPLRAFAAQPFDLARDLFERHEPPTADAPGGR